MNNGQRKLSYVAAFFAVWTALALVFVSLSSATALGGGNQPNLRLLFLIQFTRFYLWGVLSPLIYRFVWRFPIEIKILNWRNLLVHLAALAAPPTPVHYSEKLFKRSLPPQRIKLTNQENR